MAIYRNVHISFWQDEDMIELTPEQKYFYLYLMTNSKTNQLGCYKISPRVMTFETGYNTDTVSKLLKFFVDNGKIMYDEASNELLIKNWLKYNWSASPKVTACIDKELKDIALQEHFDYIKAYVGELYQYSIDTVSIHHRNKNKNKNKNKPIINKEKEEASGKPDYPAFAIELSKLILESSSVKKPTSKQIEAGADVIVKLETLDGYTPDEIQTVIRWALADSVPQSGGFCWAKNVQSGASLRNKKNGAGDVTKFAKIYNAWKRKPETEEERMERLRREI